MQLSLLPDEAERPKLPAGTGLVRTALDMLLTGQSIDQPYFLEKTGSWRLSEYVRELRALGWPVRSLDVPAPTGSNLRRYIARYWIDGSDLVTLRKECGEP